MIKNLIITAAAALIIVFALLFGVDAEVARQDRAEGREVTGCIFSVNCWQEGER